MIIFRTCLRIIIICDFSIIAAILQEISDILSLTQGVDGHEEGKTGGR